MYGPRETAPFCPLSSCHSTARNIPGDICCLDRKVLSKIPGLLSFENAISAPLKEHNCEKKNKLQLVSSVNSVILGGYYPQEVEFLKFDFPREVSLKLSRFPMSLKTTL